MLSLKNPELIVFKEILKGMNMKQSKIGQASQVKKTGMRELAQLLNKNQCEAVYQLKEKVSQHYHVIDIILFGSTAKGTAEEESDLDVLIITQDLLSHRERKNIHNLVTKINWSFDSNLSVTLADEYSWNHGIYSLMLFKEEVLRDGVVLS